MAIVTPVVVVILNNSTKQREQRIRDKEAKKQIEEPKKQPSDKSGKQPNGR